MHESRELLSAQYLSAISDDDRFAAERAASHRRRGPSLQFASTAMGVAIVGLLAGTFALGLFQGEKSHKPAWRAANGDWLMRWMGSDLTWEEYNQQQADEWEERFAESQREWQEQLPEDSALSRWQESSEPPAWSE